MKMDKVANSGNDEFYTPNYAIEPIIKHLKKGSKILCPFDNDMSNFVKILKNRGFDVVNTHLETGKDFFSYTKEEVESFDYIISNPPYSLKTEVLDKLFELGKPFAMLLGVVGIFESKKRFNLFKGNKFEVMYFNKRIAYFKDFNEQKPSLNPPFSSVYICSNVLGDRIVFEEVEK